ncbi:MAG: uroporphyrinogen decarboxylase family protein [Spirochaetia bacterium]
MIAEPIYPYVPFAGALVWNRAQADGSPVKVHVSFSPDWFAARMGLDMGERWHTDPVHRRRSFAAMARALNAEFPRLRLGGDPEAIRGGLSQIAGCAPVGALFGQEILYSRSAWPENNRHLLDDAAADALSVPDFEACRFFSDLMRQMDVIQKEWGAIDGELNYQGILNTAFRLRGEQIFTDMVTAPERAHHVLDMVCETTVRFADAVYERQARSGVTKNYFVTSNCVVNMISEDHYRQFVMPCDRRLSEHYTQFGVHNCGWKVDAYAKAYSEIRELGYLDFGIQSNLDALKRLFPRTVLTVILNPDDVIGRSTAEVRTMLEKLRDSLGVCRILLGSLDGRTKSREVEEFFSATAEVWGLPVEQLVPRPHFG